MLYTLKIIGLIVLSLYIIVCIIVYFFQEKLLFHPQKLPQNHHFQFQQQFEEIAIPTPDKINLHGLLFTVPNSKGLVFYLHGNAGSLDSWGEVAAVYTNFKYDVFLLDYRGYGKSEGDIYSQKQLLDDVQLAYDTLKKRYNEQNIILLGYSMGTGMASYLAAHNAPKMLILQAPYYSLVDVVQSFFALTPSFVIRYKMETYKNLPTCTMPIVLFHGDKDEVIYYGSSLKLKPLLKSTDTLITLENEGHNGMTYNLVYQEEIAKLLK